MSDSVGSLGRQRHEYLALLWAQSERIDELDARVGNRGNATSWEEHRDEYEEIFTDIKQSILRVSVIFQNRFPEHAGSPGSSRKSDPPRR